MEKAGLISSSRKHGAKYRDLMNRATGLRLAAKTAGLLASSLDNVGDSH
jgi:hypothetical protein